MRNLPSRVATTFGTASTGTAIATLSGAAATNAALAWLGGGAVAVSGGGMVAGNALLALAGPVGWAIGGATLAGSGIMLSKQNEKIAKEANSHTWKIKADTSKVTITKKEVGLLQGTTVEIADLIQSELRYLEKNAPSNYQIFSESLQERLLILINSIKALSSSLKKTVDLNS